MRDFVEFPPVMEGHPLVDWAKVDRFISGSDPDTYKHIISRRQVFSFLNEPIDSPEYEEVRKILLLANATEFIQYLEQARSAVPSEEAQKRAEENEHEEMDNLLWKIYNLVGPAGLDDLYIKYDDFPF